MTVANQPHSAYDTRQPASYNAMDVNVGNWIANLTTGQAWQIIAIESKTTTNITAIVQDVYRYNTFRDSAQVGNGSPLTGNYVTFEIGPDGAPQIDPVPAAGTSAAFGINLQSRFEYINLQYDYPLFQLGNTFEFNDVIAADANTNSFVLADSNNRIAVGRVTSVSDTIDGWFTINPVQKIVDNLDYLPGDIGDIIYTSLTSPGDITLTPGGTEIYINLRKFTPSVTRSTLQGPTTSGNVFQLNGVDIVIGGAGAELDLLAAVNAKAAQTGVNASLVLSNSSVQTNNSLISTTYGEPALWASSSPATATINGTSVTFDITSTDVGYEDYARPAQMAQSINNANIPDIVASTSGLLTLVVTNTAGGSITIVNNTLDINSVPFAGNLSGSGLELFTAASTTDVLEFASVDARPINFLDVTGTPLLDYGLTSVENGIKACGLYIEEGLRAAETVVVTNLTQLAALSPLIGDQAYVIDSDDGNGNDVGEWSLWLFNGSSWIQTSNQDSSSTDAKSIEHTFNFGAPAAFNVGSLSTGRRVSLITVEIITPFDAPASLEIGYQVNNPIPQPPVTAGLMAHGLIDLTSNGTYTTYTDILFGTDTAQGDVTITANFNGNGATIGTAQIIVSYM